MRSWPAMLPHPLRLNAESLLHGMSRSRSALAQTDSVRPDELQTGPDLAAQVAASTGHRRLCRDPFGHGRADTNLAGFGIGLAHQGRRDVGAGREELSLHALQKAGEAAARSPRRRRAAPSRRLASGPACDEGRMPCEAGGPTASPCTGEEHEQRVPHRT